MFDAVRSVKFQPKTVQIMSSETKLMASEGLLMGWCLFHKVSRRAVEENGSNINKKYEADLLKLNDWLSWRNIGDPNVIAYDDYKTAVMQAVSHELSHNSWMYNNSSSIHDVSARSRMGSDWARMTEEFLLVTQEDAAEIEALSGAGEYRKRALAAKGKPYLQKR